MQTVDPKQKMALEAEPCKWFSDAIQLLAHINRFPVEPLAGDYGDLEAVSYREWVGDARFIGDLDLREPAFGVIVVGMGAFHDEHWVNNLTLSYLKYLMASGGSGDFDGLYWIDHWIRTNKATCLKDPVIARWVASVIGCIELSWIVDDSRDEYTDLRGLIGT